MYLSTVIQCYQNNVRFYVDSYLNLKSEKTILRNGKLSIVKWKKMLKNHNEKWDYFLINYYKTKYPPTLSYIYSEGPYKQEKYEN